MIAIATTFSNQLEQNNLDSDETENSDRRSDGDVSESHLELPPTLSTVEVRYVKKYTRVRICLFLFIYYKRSLSPMRLEPTTIICSHLFNMYFSGSMAKRILINHLQIGCLIFIKSWTTRVFIYQQGDFGTKLEYTFSTCLEYIDI